MINDRTPRPVTESDVAVATFLARYTGPTRKAYTAALRRFQDWYGPDILHATRADIELFSHHLQDDCEPDRGLTTTKPPPSLPRWEARGRRVLQQFCGTLQQALSDGA